MRQKNQYQRRVSACVRYQAYVFPLPKELSKPGYARLRRQVERLGQNRNPPALQVLHIEHPEFFIDFPAYGFPSFKISFYPDAPAQIVARYLGYLNQALTESLAVAA